MRLDWLRVAMNEFAGGDAGGGGGGGGVPSSSSGGGGGMSGGAQSDAPRQAVPPASQSANDSGGDAQGEGVDPSKPPAPKYKLKRGGKELEHTGAELARMLADDYEHEFPGPGGKPVKLNWRGLGRAVQMSQGFEAKVQQHQEAARKWNEGIEWAKQPGAEMFDRESGEKYHEYPNVLSFLESELGIPNAEAFCMRIYAKHLQQQAEIAKLAQDDPYGAQRRIEDIAVKRLERKTLLDKQRTQREQQNRERQAREQSLHRAYSDALKEAGLPADSQAIAVVRKIMQDHAQMGVRLSKQDTMDLAREKIYGGYHSFLDSLPEEQLLTFLGDERRKKLRELETKALRGQRNEQRREERAAETQQQRQKPKGLTEREIMKREGWT